MPALKLNPEYQSFTVKEWKAMRADPVAERAFIEFNLRLVSSIVKTRFRRLWDRKEFTFGDRRDSRRRSAPSEAYITYDDLVQEGVPGLYKAMRKFDPSKGYRFSTYATWWIRQTIHRSIMNHGYNLIRLPSYIYVERSKLLREANSADGITLDDQEKLERLEATQRQSYVPIRLSEVVGGDSGTGGGAMLESFLSFENRFDTDPVVNAERSDAVAWLRETMDLVCTPRERLVLYWRFECGRTLKEIGKDLDPEIGRERVRQIEEKALAKITEEAVKRNERPPVNGNGKGARRRARRKKRT